MTPPEGFPRHLMAMPRESRRYILGLTEEVVRLRGWKAELERAAAEVMDERMSGDERHCTCVPLLRRECERLRDECDECRRLLREALQACEVYLPVVPDDQARVALLTLEWYEAAKAAGGES